MVIIIGPERAITRRRRGICDMGGLFLLGTGCSAGIRSRYTRLFLRAEGIRCGCVEHELSTHCLHPAFVRYERAHSSIEWGNIGRVGGTIWRVPCSALLGRCCFVVCWAFQVILERLLCMQERSLG